MPTDAFSTTLYSGGGDVMVLYNFIHQRNGIPSIHVFDPSTCASDHHRDVYNHQKKIAPN